MIHSIYKISNNPIGNTYLILRVLRKYPMNIQVNKEEDTDIFLSQICFIDKRISLPQGKSRLL